MKNEKTTLNDRLFTTKYLPSKNIYPPKDFSTPSIRDICEGDWRGLQEIPQLIIVNEILLQPTSRRFLRELDEAPGENNLQYIY